MILPLEVRWISLYPTIHRILELYPQIEGALNEIYHENNDLEAKIYAEQLHQFEKIALFLLFDSILSKIYEISKIFQNENINLTEILTSMEILQSFLNKILQTKFISNEFEQLVINLKKKNETIFFKDIQVSIDQDDCIENIKNICLSIVSQIKKNLEKRFLNEGIFASYEKILFGNLKKAKINELDTFANSSIIEIMNQLNNLCLY